MIKSRDLVRNWYKEFLFKFQDEVEMDSVRHFIEQCDRDLSANPNRRFLNESPWNTRLAKVKEASLKVFTELSCAVTPSMSPSSSLVLSPVNGPLIMELRSSGRTTMLGNGTRTFLFWGKGNQKSRY
ncbi:hypothetical protein LWI28_020916 [Acer negundo]|uniref:Uncharacterized protein n=1 Tax=Acer negundo TaxID=4023 RepID=A0AAD5I719_ACENE|nr:hypothetical protein LWI28_020916 [Acer negundo]